MRITKVKFSLGSGRIMIEYGIPVQGEPGEYDEYTCSLKAQPAPEFPLAMQALVPHALNILELPEEYGKRITACGVSFSYGGENDVMGATMSFQRVLKFTAAPFTFNTPHKASEPYSEGGDEAECMDRSLVMALHEVQYQAERYVNGDRLQTEMFATNADASAFGATSVEISFPSTGESVKVGSVETFVGASKSIIADAKRTRKVIVHQAN